MISIFSGKKEKNLNELKQELEIDVHRVSADDFRALSSIFQSITFLDNIGISVKVSVDELCKRFGTNIADGLTDDQVVFLFF